MSVTLGYTSVGSNYRELGEGNNGSHNVVTYVTPETDIEVSSFTFYGSSQYPTPGIFGGGPNMYFSIGTLGPIVGSAAQGLTQLTYGDANQYGYINWPLINSIEFYGGGAWRTYNYTIEPKPYLTAGTTYVLAMSGSNRYYPWKIYYNDDVSQTEPTHWYSGKWAYDQPERSYSIYITGEPVVSGPSIKVDGITPGKIEQISWSEVSDVH
jgi:hypothetical protein